MSATQETTGDEVAVLPGDVPVTMPDLPPRRVLTTAAQFGAMSDPVRARILVLIQHEPATAKQIATRLGLTPGAIGHHLHVLEAAGLVQVVARRLVRGIVAKYYTRTARIFQFEIAPDAEGAGSVPLGLITRARDELAESLAGGAADPCLESTFTHVRLTPERAAVYQDRLVALIGDLLAEPPAAEGTVYGFLSAFFESPALLQHPAAAEPA